MAKLGKLIQSIIRSRAKLIAFGFVMITIVGSISYLLDKTGAIRRNTTQLVHSERESLRQLATANPLQLAYVLDESIVQIMAGDFLMGSDSGHADERPTHIVYLDAFEIDRYEVTNIQYQRFIQETGHRVPFYWTNDQYPADQADYPVVGVSWEDAEAYCSWAGKRLPTEAEWEKACRGTDARIYPWGNQWKPHWANVDVSIRTLRPVGHDEFETSVWDMAWQFLRTTPAAADQPGLQPVGSYPEGASPYGLMDMVGNASEWVADWYNWSDYTHMPTRNPLNTAPPWNHCLRGSAWHDPVGDAAWVQDMSRCTARSSSHAGNDDPRLGFRCARTLTP